MPSKVTHGWFERVRFHSKRDGSGIQRWIIETRNRPVIDLDETESTRSSLFVWRLAPSRAQTNSPLNWSRSYTTWCIVWSLWQLSSLSPLQCREEASLIGVIFIAGVRYEIYFDLVGMISSCLTRLARFSSSWRRTNRIDWFTRQSDHQLLFVITYSVDIYAQNVQGKVTMSREKERFVGEWITKSKLKERKNKIGHGRTDRRLKSSDWVMRYWF